MEAARAVAGTRLKDGVWSDGVDFSGQVPAA
jgi:hypothetical protein